MEHLESGSLKILISIKDNVTTLTFEGKSSEREPAKILNPFFEKILSDLRGELIVDFRPLDFMNSSTVIPLIQFIKKLEEKEIKTIFYYNKESKWQATSFQAFITITKQLKYINFEGK